MNKSNFKDYHKSQSDRLDPINQEKLKDSISSNVGIISFIGNLVDLYIPQGLKTMIHMLDGQNDDATNMSDDSHYPNTKF